MQNRFRIQWKTFTGTLGMKIAAILVAGMTLVTLLLRVILTPQMQDVETGFFRLSYAIIAVMALTILAAAVLSWCSPAAPVRLGGKWLTAAALAAILAGGVMTLTSVMDACGWLFWRKTPPPNESVISTVDGLTLFFTLVFGALGGVTLVRVGLLWLSENRHRSGVLAWWALAPVGWVWMRLARYEVSYASAVDVSQSFYDFVMLIFTLLFFFVFARSLSGLGAKKPRMLFFLSLATALCSLSGPLTRMCLFLTGEYDAYNASPLAGPTDGLVGLFALLFALGLAFDGRAEEEAPDEDAPDSPAAPAASPSVDDILNELYPRDE